jgi:L-ascorbate metabolism protein UlaG (beta-lactamase superfamily)
LHGYDHPTATLSKLTGEIAACDTPLDNDATMRSADSAIKAEGFDWHQRVELGDGIADAVPTRHRSARGLFDRNKALGPLCAETRRKTTSSAIPL